MEKDEDDFDLEKEYGLLRQRYNLPDYARICEDFDVQKAADKETDFLLREIRRAMNEKVGAYLHLLETLINPASPPVFLFPLIHDISDSDKRNMKEVYTELAKVQIKIMKLDCVYSEKAEADFVAWVFNMWQRVKVKISNFVDKFEVSFDKDNSVKDNSYFD